MLMCLFHSISAVVPNLFTPSTTSEKMCLSMYHHYNLMLKIQQPQRSQTSYPTYSTRPHILLCTVHKGGKCIPHKNFDFSQMSDNIILYITKYSLYLSVKNNFTKSINKSTVSQAIEMCCTPNIQQVKLTTILYTQHLKCIVTVPLLRVKTYAGEMYNYCTTTEGKNICR